MQEYLLELMSGQGLITKEMIIFSKNLIAGSARPASVKLHYQAAMKRRRESHYPWNSLWEAFALSILLEMWLSRSPKAYVAVIPTIERQIWHRIAEFDSVRVGEQDVGRIG